VRVSEYIPRYIDKDAWKAINIVIRSYPKMYVELAEQERDILYGTPQKQEGGRSGYVGNPTEAKAMKLSSARREKLQRECDAVTKCLEMLVPEHYRMVCLRFWGVENTEKAFYRAKHHIKLRGMKYQTNWYEETAPDKAGYSVSTAKGIVRGFIALVGKEIGEI
jgi:hypothetical protein